MDKPVLIVIPCLNETAHIERLVESLVSNYKDLPVHIVIADGGSTDGTISAAKQLDKKYSYVSYLNNPQKIQSAAVNRAVATYGADCEWLIRLDAHADYPPDFCRILLEEAQKTGADSVVVAMDTVGKAGFQKAVAAAQNSKLGNGGAAHRNAGQDGAWVDHGHHALMSIAAFQAVGGYDENFSHNEDAELDLRLRAAGYKIWLTGRTALNYYPRAAAGPLFRQYYKFGQGRARTVLKHRIIPKIRQLVPAVVAPAAILALLEEPLGDLAALPLIVWALICLTYGGSLAFKARDRELLAIGPALMIMHFSWSLGFWSGLLTGMLKR
ncbi:MAG: glycosyltransferase family 2 protein [Rhodospirillales bacterium]|nr:glycosyltransferase family 2 protein [Rhodospirillales bacterium]